MKRNKNWKNSDFKDYDYLPFDKENKYYKNHYTIGTVTKLNNYDNRNNKKYQKEKYFNDFYYSSKYTENENQESFYPKNYADSKKRYSNGYNNNEQNNFSYIKKNDYFNYEKPKINKNFEKNEVEIEKTQKNDEAIYLNYYQNMDNEEEKNNDVEIEKSKKIGIKNIPHPKIKKNKRNSYISGKKLIENKQKKEEEKNIKKERKISISSSNQNNFDGSRISISTLNTSSSSVKEKDVSNEEKAIININEKDTNLINEKNEIYNTNNNNHLLKNKLDENIETEKYQYINKYLENTEILKVNVKISEKETVIFKLRRFDDLFLTIKLFCEINSIDEKLIKPFIIKSLSTLNLIYQVYNSQVSNENISILKRVKILDEIQK
jgi:hypothetical protein